MATEIDTTSRQLAAERRACDLACEALRHVKSSRQPQAPEELRQMAEDVLLRVAGIRGEVR